MKNQSIQAIFLVGCPRSGTTLLQSLLAAHPEVISFPESKFFEYLVPQYEPRRLKLGIASRRLRPMLVNFFEEIGHCELQRRLPLTPLFMRQYVNLFRSSLNKIASSQGKSIWIEKTPGHLHYIDSIEKFLPDAKVIHILRNGSDVVASLQDAFQTNPKIWGEAYQTIDGCIDEWIRDLEITKAHIHKPNHTLIKYEKLVEIPQEVLEKICEFIGIGFDEKMLENYRDVSKQLIRDREQWKGSVSSNIQNANSQKFYKVFNEKQRQYILDRLSSVNLSDLDRPTL